MRIAINTLAARGGGGSTFPKNLIAALAEEDKENEYFIFVTEQKEKEFKVKRDNFRFIVCPFASRSVGHRVFWEQTVLPFILKRNKIDVLYLPNSVDIFFAPVRSIITITNMGVFCYGRYPNSKILNIRILLLNKLSKLSLKSSDRVVAVSNFVRDYINEKLGVPWQKIKMIYHGKDEMFCLSSSDAKRDYLKTLGISGDYIFTASKMVPYTNLHGLIEGFELFKKKEANSSMKLLVAGERWDDLYYETLQDLIERNGLKDDVIFLGYVPYDQMPTLHWNARLFVLPSTLEACPITLIEAMGCGAIIAASNIDPIPEICQDTALYFDPYDPEDIAEKIELGLRDEELRRRLSKKAVRRSKDFCWERAARQTLAVFKEVYDKGHNLNAKDILS